MNFSLCMYCHVHVSTSHANILLFDHQGATGVLVFLFMKTPEEVGMHISGKGKLFVIA